VKAVRRRHVLLRSHLNGKSDIILQCGIISCLAVRGKQVKVGYIVHDLNDSAVHRRIRMLRTGGAEVRLAGFVRGNRLDAAPRALDPLVLGHTADAAMVQRAAAVLARALRPAPLAEAFRDADVIVARNLESLGIARAVVGSRPLAYECLDIHRSLTGTGLPSRLIQRVEAALLPRVDLLMTSSPAFVRVHFARRPQLRAPTFLIENKLLALDDEVPVAPPAPPLPPFVIGWFGMLRCRRSLAELSALARRMEGRVRVLIAGKPSPAEFPDWDRQVSEAPHLEYAGPYVAADLPALYARCHFAWTIDWFEEGANSSWLLPNRLYEAQAFGVVPIVDAGVEVGQWLEAAGTGIRLTRGTNELAAELGELDAGGYAGLRAAVSALPRDRLIATRADADALVARLAELRER
jgi:succinoglycan biosynthesis protein ExoL